MLRITKVIGQNPSEVTLTLEGRLAAEWVPLLESQCWQCLKEKARVRLDFSEVTFVDDEGLKMLRSLAAENIEIIDLCGFIRDSVKSQEKE